MEMNNVVISIGSNCPEREREVEKSIRFLSEKLDGVRASDCYSTPASNGKDADYLNAVLVATTDYSRERVVSLLKLYEVANGRTALSKQEGIIPIDLDLVMWNGAVVRQNDFDKDYFQIGWKQLEK